MANSSSCRDWRYSLNSHPFCKKLREVNTQEKIKLSQNVSKGLIAFRDGSLFVWDIQSSHLVHLNLLLASSNGGPKDDDTDRTGQFQILTCSPIPGFSVERILFNKSGHSLAIWGQVGITIIQMPQTWERNVLFTESKENILCRTFPLAERLFASHGDLGLLQVLWHPGSAEDNHIAFLTSDNIIRIHNIYEPEKMMQIISLGQIDNSRGLSAMHPSLYSVFGDSAVSFDFGTPVHVPSKLKSARTKNSLAWPIFILQGNGEILILYSDITSKNPKCYPVMGPLLVHPPAEDNYGTDACSILCLQTTPPVIVMATCEGKLHHCIVLNENNNTEPTSPSASELASSSHLMSLQEERSMTSIASEIYEQKSLFVYESVELELSLASLPQMNSNNDPPEEDEYTCPIHLEQDPTSEDRYHCIHAAGVHTVALPWLAHYEKFCAEDEEEPLPDMSLHDKSIVEHLICTKPLTSSPPFPILGLATINNHLLGNNLIVLTTDMDFLTIPLSDHYKLPPAMISAMQTTSKTMGSPFKELSKEPFDKHISKILQRTTSTPLLKGSKTMNISQEECYMLLIRSTKVFREQYIQKQDLAMEEIKRRINILQTHKTHQLSALENLEHSKNLLRDSTQSLAEKYESCKENQDQLLNRLKVVIRKVQSRLPILSDAEQDMHKELKEMEVKLRSLEKSLKETQKKKQFQEHQISVHQRDMSSSSSLNNQNLIQIKDILKDQNDEIADLMKSVKSLKLDTLR